MFDNESYARLEYTSSAEKQGMQQKKRGGVAAQSTVNGPVWIALNKRGKERASITKQPTHYYRFWDALRQLPESQPLRELCFGL
jgi:hypothetical protein